MFKSYNWPNQNKYVFSIFKNGVQKNVFYISQSFVCAWHKISNFHSYLGIQLLLLDVLVLKTQTTIITLKNAVEIILVFFN